MKKILLGTLGTAVMMAAAAVGYLYLRKPAIAPPPAEKIEATQARIERGKYLFNLADCDGCHSQRELGLPGKIAASNITSDPETGIGAWTDGEKIRAIREGISRDGRSLFPMMPYGSLRHMSDEDVYSLVAFLNTLPPVKHRVPRSQINFPVSLLIKSEPRPAGSIAAPDRSDRVKYGEYLATVANCTGCHTPAMDGRPIDRLTLAGGEKFRFPGIMVVSANITPDPETGIGRWSEQDFVDRFRQYRDYADHGSPETTPENFTVMPWLAFSHVTDEDLAAIYTYLLTQRPIRHVVDSHPGADPPKQNIARGAF